jgi:hypothetical protein
LKKLGRLAEIKQSVLYNDLEIKLLIDTRRQTDYKKQHRG